MPLIIFANWRGTDMYHDILRQGSAIVKALVDYTQPVYIYIQPYCQLRGGAMVVLSKSINNRSARVNILEPSGVLPIKYKTKDIQSTMKRHGVEMTEKNTELFQRVALDFIEKHDIPTKNNGSGALGYESGIFLWAATLGCDTYHRFRSTGMNGV